MNNIILFEDINFDDLVLYSDKKDRKIFFHKSEPLAYKFFSDDWEFANQLEIAIKNGYYDKELVPNFIGLIKDKKGLDKGYLCYRVNKEQILENCLLKKFSLSYFKKLINGSIKLTDFFSRSRYKPNSDYLIKFLDIVFSRSQKTQMLFIEVDLPNLWISNKGYHIFDLDAIRSFNWVFCQNKNDPEYIRKIINKKNFNRDLRKIIELHGFKFPFEINYPEDIEKFLSKFRKENNLQINERSRNI